MAFFIIILLAAAIIFTYLWTGDAFVNYIRILWNDQEARVMLIFILVILCASLIPVIFSFFEYINEKKEERKRKIEERKRKIEEKHRLQKRREEIQQYLEKVWSECLRYMPKEEFEKQYGEWKEYLTKLGFLKGCWTAEAIEKYGEDTLLLEYFKQYVLGVRTCEVKDMSMCEYNMALASHYFENVFLQEVDNRLIELIQKWKGRYYNEIFYCKICYGEKFHDRFVKEWDVLFAKFDKMNYENKFNIRRNIMKYLVKEYITDLEEIYNRQPSIIYSYNKMNCYKIVNNRVVIDDDPNNPLYEKFGIIEQNEELIRKIADESILKALRETSRKISMTNEEAYKYIETICQLIQQKLYSSKYERFQTLVEKCFQINKHWKYLENRGFMEAVKTLHAIFEYMDKEYLVDDAAHYMRQIRIGYEGEKEVCKELEFFSNHVEILKNIRLEINGQSVEMDTILIAPEGVFVLEVKNIGAFTKNFFIEIDKDGRWRKVYSDGKKEEIMKSISHQNARHVHGVTTILNKNLSKELNDYACVKSMIVFANDNVDISNNSEETVVRKSEIMSVIQKKDKIYGREMIQKMKTTLLENTLPPKKYEFDNLNNVLDYHVILKTLIDTYQQQFPELEATMISVIESLEKKVNVDKYVRKSSILKLNTDFYQ